MKNGIVTGITLFFSVAIIGQNFQRFIGGDNDDVGQSLVLSNDGGYFLTGETMSYGFGQQDFILSKFNSNHELEYSKVYGTGGNEFGTSFSVLELTNGDLILTGRREQGPGQPDRALVWRTDPFGNTIWSKRFVGTGGAYADVFGKGIELDDGSIILLGSCQSMSTGNQDTFMAKIDGNGNLLASKSLGGNSPDHALKILPVDNNEFVVMHNGVSYGPGSRSGGLLRIDSDLNVLWYKKHGEWSDEGLLDMEFLTDGNILSVGYTRSFGGDRKGLAVKMDLNGDLIWAKSLNVGNQDDRLTDVVRMSNGSLILVMTSESQDEIIHINCDQDLNPISAYSFGIASNSFIEKQHNEGSVEFGSDVIMSVGVGNGTFSAMDDIYQIVYSIDNPPCDFENVSIDIEDIGLMSIEPNYNQTSGGSLEDYSLNTQDVSNELEITEECNTQITLCDIQGGFGITGLCSDDLTFFDFNILDYADTEVNWIWTVNDVTYTQSDPQVNFTDSGSYAVELFVEDILDPSCNMSFDTTIVVFEQPEFSIVFPDSSCVGTLVSLAIPEALDAVTWSNGMDGQNISFELNNDFIVTAEGELNGCFSSETVELISVQVPSPIVQAPEEICENELFEVEILGNDFNIEWSWGGNEMIFDTLLFQASNFQFEAYNSHCSNDYSFDIDVLNPPNLNLIGPEFICENLNAQLFGQGADEYFWSTGETGSTIDFLFTSDTSISVIGTNACGQDLASISVSVFENNIENQETFFFSGQYGDNILFEFPEGLNYTLFDQNNNELCHNCNGLNYNVVGNENLILTYTNEFGCSSSGSVIIEALPCSPLFAPNSFTPNGDGINDYFKPVLSEECLSYFNLTVYNRWGEVVFESDKFSSNWNGQGQRNDDFYSEGELFQWILEYRYSYEPEIQKQSGTIFLIR